MVPKLLVLTSTITDSRTSTAPSFLSEIVQTLFSDESTEYTKNLVCGGDFLRLDLLNPN